LKENALGKNNPGNNIKGNENASPIFSTSVCKPWTIIVFIYYVLCCLMQGVWHVCPEEGKGERERREGKERGEGI
jgi:hypothetical protein